MEIDKKQAIRTIKKALSESMQKVDSWTNIHGLKHEEYIQIRRENKLNIQNAINFINSQKD